ncbi:hypothetical protein ACLOJK_018742, partial [Asimina triloba]
ADLDMNDNVNVVEVEDEYHQVGQGGEVSVSEKLMKDETNETNHSMGEEKGKYIAASAAGTAAGGATVAGRRHRDGTRHATGSHNPQ